MKALYNDMGTHIIPVSIGPLKIKTSPNVARLGNFQSIRISSATSTIISSILLHIHSFCPFLRLDLIVQLCI